MADALAKASKHQLKYIRLVFRLNSLHASNMLIYFSEWSNDDIERYFFKRKLTSVQVYRVKGDVVDLVKQIMMEVAVCLLSIYW